NTMSKIGASVAKVLKRLQSFRPKSIFLNKKRESGDSTTLFLIEQFLLHCGPKAHQPMAEE
ncbi:MAG: hypothetical protein WCG99_00545, partial [Candidatus Berkelbacteria bacterium]